MNPTAPPPAIARPLYMILTGYAALVGLPALSTAWSTTLHCGQADVGLLSATELGGLSAGAVLCATLLRGARRAHVVFAAAIVALLANLASASVPPVAWLMVWRGLAGLASGAYVASALAVLSAHPRPERAYSYALLTFAFSQALELAVLPMLSLHTIYLVFAGMYVAPLLFAWGLPDPPLGSAGPDALRARPPWPVFSAIFAGYVAVGAYWTYIELAGKTALVPALWMSRSLVASSVFSALGCLAAAALSARYRLRHVLCIAFVAQAGIVLSALELSPGSFAFGVCGFSAVWMLTDVLQMAVLAKADPSGHLAALAPGAQGLGQIVGPTVAATVLTTSAGYRGVFVLCAVACGFAAATYAVSVLSTRAAGARALGGRP